MVANNLRRASGRFLDGEFKDNRQLVAAVEGYLLTNIQRRAIEILGIDLSKLVDGVCQNKKFADAIYREWNSKLGFGYFYLGR